jgi:hypothetical protein
MAVFEYQLQVMFNITFDERPRYIVTLAFDIQKKKKCNFLECQQQVMQEGEREEQADREMGRRRNETQRAELPPPSRSAITVSTTPSRAISCLHGRTKGRKKGR